MKHLLAALLILLPSLAPAVTRFTGEDAALLQEGLVTTADVFIVPGYAAWSEAATGLTDATQAYCAGQGPLETAHARFGETFLAWQRISVIGFGPITEGEGPMRVQVWPDPKGFSRRAIRTAVKAADPALLEPGGLTGRSVALVNLTALEELLYRDLAPGTYPCDLAVALSAHQAALAQDITGLWTDSAFRTAFDTAAVGNDRYPDVDSLIREMLAGAVVFTDRLRKFRLERGLGLEAGSARPERTEARKSDLGLASLQVSFQALRDFYEVPYGFFDVTPDLGGSMDFFMLGEGAGNISASLSIETRSLAEIAEADGPLAADLRRYAQLLLFHESYLKIGLPSSLGLTAGFTSADGD